MSIDLDVRLVRPIELSDLLNSTRAVIKELLSIREVPPLRADSVDKGIRTPITSGLIEKGRSFMISLEGFEDAVSLVVFEIKKAEPYVTDKYTGLRTGISVGWLRSHSEFALAASVAVAIARLAHTVVEDPGTCWTPNLEQQPDSFAEAVKVRGTFDSILSAAEAFYEALPVAKIGRNMNK